MFRVAGVVGKMFFDVRDGRPDVGVLWGLRAEGGGEGFGQFFSVILIERPLSSHGVIIGIYQDSHPFALGLVECRHERLFPAGDLFVKKFRRRQEGGGGMSAEHDAACFRKVFQSFFKYEIMRIGEMDLGEFPGEHVAEIRGVGNDDQFMTEFSQLIRICLHRCAVQDEFLFVKSDGIFRVISEKQRVFGEIDGPAFCDRGVVCEELMGKNEGDGGHRAGGSDGFSYPHH